jgi:hypothetical protein
MSPARAGNPQIDPRIRSEQSNPAFEKDVDGLSLEDV